MSDFRFTNVSTDDDFANGLVRWRADFHGRVPDPRPERFVPVPFHSVPDRQVFYTVTLPDGIVYGHWWDDDAVRADNPTATSIARHNGTKVEL